MGSKREPHERSPAQVPGKPPPRIYRVELKPTAERDLAALQHKDRVRVAKKIDALAKNPRPSGVEKLRGENDLWRVRVGNYRIIYTIRDDLILVLVVRIGNRREVYR